VLAVEPVNNRVVVGPADELAVAIVEADRAVWFAPAAGTFACEVQVRAHGAPVGATATVLDDGSVQVVVEPGLRGVAPGQSLVLYEGSRVLGQATVTGTRRHAPTPAAAASIDAATSNDTATSIDTAS
jgi:tRNA-specific 2-thiouridylase